MYQLDDIQREVFDCRMLKSKGLSRKQIAEQLGLTERQVKRRLASNELSINSSHIHNRGGIVGGTINADKLTSAKANEVVINTESGKVFLSGSISGDTPSWMKSKIEDWSVRVFDVEPEPFPMFPDKDESLFSHEDADKKRSAVTAYFTQKYAGKTCKILNIADLHIPFTDYKSVQGILREHSDADVLMINGDLLDLFAVSKYAKDKEVALKREIEEGRDFLEFVSKKFKDVVITDGNHERRLKHFVTNMIPSDMQFLFPQDILQVTVSGDVLKKKPLSNVHVVGSWWVKLFDTIFAHPDNYAGANLKTVQNTSEHFLLVKNEWHRMCIIGHTHRAGWLIAGEVKLMETGCLCHDMDYHNGSKFTRTKWTKAYSVVYIGKDGLSDFNKSTVYLV
jgi:predicted phosphodiesterase/predicted transcriptional regulator